MKVSDIKPYSLAKKEIEDKLIGEIKNSVESRYASLSGFKQGVLSNDYKIAMYVMFLTIIIGIIMYLIRASTVKAFTNDYLEQVGNFNVYKKAIATTGLAKAEDIAKISNRLHYKLRVSPVPSDARIITRFTGIYGQTDKETDFITNAVKFMWRRSNGKNTQTYYYTQAMLIVNTDFMDDLEFNIERDGFFKKVFRREKLQLENPEFEKMFSIVRNDEGKIRQCFTPLIQENYVIYTLETKLAAFRMIKQYDEVYIVWGTRDDYLYVKNRTISDTTAEGIANGIMKNISKDVGEFYTALAYVLSLPLFSPERTRKKNIGSDEDANEMDKSQIMRMMKHAVVATAVESD